jgi:hypothetical protein
LPHCIGPNAHRSLIAFQRLRNGQGPQPRHTAPCLAAPELPGITDKQFKKMQVGIPPKHLQQFTVVLEDAVASKMDCLRRCQRSEQCGGRNCLHNRGGRYPLRDPNACGTNGNFAATGRCKAHCTASTISNGVQSSSGSNCASGVSNVVQFPLQ